MNEVQYYDSAQPRHRMLSELRELYQYRDLIGQMTTRNVTLRYKRSFLGIVWTLLDPLMTMLVMAFVFSALLQRKVPNFSVYLLTGLMVWNYFAQATNSAMNDMSNSEKLLSKVYLPQSVFVIVAMGTGLVNFVLSLIALLVIAVITGAPISIYALTLIVPLLILTIFNLGIGLLLAPLNMFFSDVGNVYNIFLRLFIYLSAIFYTVDILPEWLQQLVNLNPVYQFIHIFRNPLHAGLPIPLDSLLYVTVWAVSLLFIGFFVFTRLSDSVAAKL